MVTISKEMILNSSINENRVRNEYKYFREGEKKKLMIVYVARQHDQ